MDIYLDQQTVAYVELGEALQRLQCPEGPLYLSLQTYLQPLQDKTLATQDDFMIEGLKALTKHFALACDSALDYANELGHVLAEATKREPLWRVLFGIAMPQPDIPFEHVFHVAMQVRQFHEQNHLELVKDCLRLVANCCADNNTNRKFCLDRRYLKQLLWLAANHFEPDILIPTIYNVCVGYEDPSAVVSETDHGMDHQQGTSATQTASSLSLAAVKLLEASQNECAAHQILLSLAPLCSEDRRAYLAELVELTCTPFGQDGESVQSMFGIKPDWFSMLDNRSESFLDSALLLARNDVESLCHVLRALTCLMSHEESRRCLLQNDDGNVWKIVTIGALQITNDDQVDDDYITELSQCHKQYLKAFYQFTGMSEFISSDRQYDEMLDKAVKAVLSQIDSHREGADQNLTIFSTIILAQLAASVRRREQLLANNSIIEMLHKLLTSTDENDVLYPTITLISRLTRAEHADTVLVQPVILDPMKRLLKGKGRGLVVPFEVVNTYKMMIRGRPDKFVYFVETKDIDRESVVSNVIELFHKTIEAGTKLEAGHFFIEVLRTMFAQMSDLDTFSAESRPPMASAFTSFLNDYAIEVCSIFTFVCSQTELREQRIHGWFALGMLSVWRQGRSAIIQTLADDNFRECLLEISKTGDSAGAQNAKLMLSKLQHVSHTKVSASLVPTLQNAAKNMGIEFEFVAT